jgi:hypothetical protein
MRPLDMGSIARFRHRRWGRRYSFLVITGRDPAIQKVPAERLDCRVKPGNDTRGALSTRFRWI